MANIDYYANQYNESKKALRQIYWDIAQKIIKNHNHQNKIHAVKNHNQITILDNQSDLQKKGFYQIPYTEFSTKIKKQKKKTIRKKVKYGFEK